MKLEIIPYLSIHHILGTASVPQGFTIAAKYPVRDETGHCLYSVEQSAAKKFVKAHQEKNSVTKNTPERGGR